MINDFAAIDWDTWQPTESATLLFVVQNKDILLIRKKRGLGAGKINGPGGRIDPGETPLQCAIRETHEELGITALDPTLCGRHRFQFSDGYALQVYVYQACEYQGTPVETDEAIPIWTKIDKIPYDEMWEDDRIWLPLLLKGKAFDGTYLFDSDRMLGHTLKTLANVEHLLPSALPS